MGNLTTNPAAICSTLRECCELKKDYIECDEQSKLSLSTDEKPCDYGRECTETVKPALDTSADLFCTSSASFPHPSKLVLSTFDGVDNEPITQHGLHRTQPGTVFSPPFKHVNQEFPSQSALNINKNKNTGNKPLRTSQSFVEFISRKWTSPFSFNNNVNTIKTNASSKNSITTINISTKSNMGNNNGDLSLAKKCLLDGESSKKSIINNISRPPSPNGSATPTTPFAFTGNSFVFTNKEEEYARKIDLFLRTRSAFDARFPLSFSMRMTTLVREFSLLDSTSAFSDNVFTTNDIIALIRKHPRFKLSRDKKMVSLVFLTPFFEDKRQILYGYFFCNQCKRRWESGASWQNSWQRCKRCHANTYPYDQHVPLSREKIMQQVYLMTHATRKNNSCPTYRRANNILSKIFDKNNDNTSLSSGIENGPNQSGNNENKAENEQVPVENDLLANELLNDDEEDSEDLFTIDMISLRDRIEYHRQQLCQKCIELGHLCIPYRHYSI